MKKPKTITEARERVNLSEIALKAAIRADAGSKMITQLQATVKANKDILAEMLKSN